MGCEGCNTRSKILFGIGGLLALVGGILFVVSVTAGAKGAEVEFLAENKLNFGMEITRRDHCGVSLYVAQSSDCGEAYSDATVKDPDNGTVYVFRDCGLPEDWATKNDPPIRKMGHFFIDSQKMGTYIVTSDYNLWAVDVCGQIGEAVGGILAMMGLFVVMIIVFVVACIMCCVGCCCMGAEAKTVVVATDRNEAIGAPAS